MYSKCPWSKKKEKKSYNSVTVPNFRDVRATHDAGPLPGCHVSTLDVFRTYISAAIVAI